MECSPDQEYLGRDQQSAKNFHHGSGLISEHGGTHPHGSLSISHAERRGVLGQRLAPIIEAGRGHVGMAEPFLHLGNIGFMEKGICGGSGPHRMHAQAC